MSTRKFCASYVFTGNGEALKYGIVELDQHGTVVNIIDTKGQMAELPSMEFHSGVIVPGFVNSHCHLELSHMRQKISRHGGLPNFIMQVGAKREKAKATIEKAMLNADAEMWQSGIVAVGDISNTKNSIKTKRKSKIHYHSFIEVFGLDPIKATEIFDNAWHTKLAFKEKELSASITPHAPYSISSKLFHQLSDYMQHAPEPISYHNQETASENSLFENGTGELFDVFRNIGIPIHKIPVTGKSSLITTLDNFSKKNNLLLIHNTYSTEKDILWAQQHHKNIYWTLCPNANLYIEDKLPNIELLRKNNAKIALGTDSLASNDQLSILEEMITINEYFPWVPFSEMLSWATINGAKALGVEKKYGSIEVGKTPGLVLIQGFDFENMQINDEAFARRLV